MLQLFNNDGLLHSYTDFLSVYKTSVWPAHFAKVVAAIPSGVCTLFRNQPRINDHHLPFNIFFFFFFTRGFVFIYLFYILYPPKAILLNYNHKNLYKCKYNAHTTFNKCLFLIELVTNSSFKIKYFYSILLPNPFCLSELFLKARNTLQKTAMSGNMRKYII